jgi:hypothetical protein
MLHKVLALCLTNKHFPICFLTDVHNVPTLFTICTHFHLVQDGHGGADARDRARKGPQTIGKIKKALDFMRNQHFEVPFIAFYRKEYVQPELNINDLWKVYKFDEKVCYFL